MSMINIYYINSILEVESSMLIPIDSVVKIEELGDEHCVLTLNSQREKVLVLETIGEIEQKIYWANQPNSKPESMDAPPWAESGNRKLLT
jgi:hypothetical protein